MNTAINTKQLLSALPSIIVTVRNGARFTVLHRGRPAFQIVPLDDDVALVPLLAKDALFGALAVGRSTDGNAGADHNRGLYGRPNDPKPTTSRR